ncbi:MAG: hypothetical protein JSV66_08095 [Trueperaceae bacterium]|nr:MAG: hypothetical protein JSV66_08095 [Trueperaceae bacterium]
MILYTTENRQAPTPKVVLHSGMRALLTHVLLTLSCLFGLALASPSAFPETALFFKGGLTFDGNGIGSAGGELVLDVPFIDASAGVEAYVGTADQFGVRLETSALVFPAFGTTPPLALGFGADVGLSNTNTSVHAGVVVGTDLLFVFDLPATVSVYLAPGYASGTGFDLAWAFQFRYFFEDLALEISSSDFLPIALGLRFPF